MNTLQEKQAWVRKAWNAFVLSLFGDKEMMLPETGEWILNRDSWNNPHHSCSACKSYLPRIRTVNKNNEIEIVEFPLTEYCPFCGTKMNGE